MDHHLEKKTSGDLRNENEIDQQKATYWTGEDICKLYIW